VDRNENENKQNKSKRNVNTQRGVHLRADVLYYDYFHTLLSVILTYHYFSSGQKLDSPLIWGGEIFLLLVNILSIAVKTY
jgi:hypothetical protein